MPPTVVTGETAAIGMVGILDQLAIVNTVTRRVARGMNDLEDAIPKVGF